MSDKPLWPPSGTKALGANPKALVVSWDEQARQLGWTSRDLFGLDTPPATPSARYARLSRYDKTGLLWLLQGRPAVARTKETATIENPTGAITTFSFAVVRRHRP